MNTSLASIHTELGRAEAARRQGKEGMARVCARRAAGMAMGVYLARQGLPEPGISAYDRLRTMQKQGGLSPRLEQAVRHLLLRVDEQFALPEGIDLIQEARTVIGELLGES